MLAMNFVSFDVEIEVPGVLKWILDYFAGKTHDDYHS